MYLAFWALTFSNILVIITNFDYIFKDPEYLQYALKVVNECGKKALKHTVK